MKSLILTTTAMMIVLTNIMPASAESQNGIKQQEAKMHRFFHANKKLATKEVSQRTEGGAGLATAASSNLDYASDSFIIN